MDRNHDFSSKGLRSKSDFLIQATLLKVLSLHIWCTFSPIGDMQVHKGSLHSRQHLRPISSHILPVLAAKCHVCLKILCSFTGQNVVSKICMWEVEYLQSHGVLLVAILSSRWRNSSAFVNYAFTPIYGSFFLPAVPREVQAWGNFCWLVSQGCGDITVFQNTLNLKQKCTVRSFNHELTRCWSFCIWREKQFNNLRQSNVKKVRGLWFAWIGTFSQTEHITLVLISSNFISKAQLFLCCFYLYLEMSKEIHLYV